MNNHWYTSLKSYSKLNSVISSIEFALLAVGLVTNDAHANFATTEGSTVAACPANHKMYYVGANSPSFSTPAPDATVPVANLPLSWTSGSNSKTFTFEGNKEFVISFPKLLLFDLNSSLGSPPFYGSLNGITTSAINLDHDSTGVKTNHNMNVSINRSVSKVGYKIQDVDSTGTVGRIPYIEEVDVSANQGQLTFNTIFHTRNPAGNVVTARSGLNCGTGECTIDASWKYNLAGTSLNLKHNNTFTQINSPHTVGYSDFYFCLAPPKLIVKKVLNGTRAGSNDQFEINTKVDESSAILNQFTTAGSAATLENSSSSVQSLKENTVYNIYENIINGNANNYSTSYSCTNATTGIAIVIRTGNVSSFTLSNLSYGDEITCTITNTPAYTFSGTIFDDNGGITAADSTKQNITSTFTANSAYFNGILDSNESGIFDSTLQVTLTNCNGTKVVTSSPNPQTVSSLGKYNFTVQPGALPTRICLVETEPTSWVYSVDTTANTREVSLTNGTYIYNNLDFGEVKADNTALVLRKYQYVHECNSNLNYTSIADTSNPSTGFSTSAPSNTIIPGKCIAYKIEAYNRGHISLSDIQISDVLQNVKVKSEFYLPKASGVPSDVFKTTNQTAPIGQNGTIVSDKFTLSNTASSTTTSKATLYFNTKYGTTSGI